MTKNYEVMAHEDHNLQAIEVLEAMDLLQTKSPDVASALEEIETVPMRRSASLPY